MKYSYLKFLLIPLVLILIIIIYLSTIGIETDKFNKQIKNRINQTYKNLDIDLKKIKLTLNPYNFKIFAKTVGSTVFLSNSSLPLEYIKSEVSLSSLIKRKIISSNIQVATRSILLNDFVKFIRATTNKPELLILEKTIKKGYVILDLNLNIDNNGKIKNDYKIDGLVKNTNVDFFKQLNFNNLNFNFQLKQDEYSLSNINFNSEEVNFISEKLNIRKKKNSFLIDGVIKNDKSNLNNNFFRIFNLTPKNVEIDNVKFSTNNKFSLEIDNKYYIKNVVLNSDININKLKYKKPEIIQKYFSDIDDFVLFENHTLKVNYKKNNLSIKGEGEIHLKNEIDKIKYLITKTNDDLKINTELSIKNVNLRNQDFLKAFFPKINKNINLNNHKLKINYNDEKLSLSGSGNLKIDKDFEEINYFFERKEKTLSFNTKLILKNSNFIIDNINYKKKDKNELNLKIKGKKVDNNNLKIDNLSIYEDNNKIEITNLILNNLNQLVKVDRVIFNYIDTENKKNNYTINKAKKNDYIINGSSFNANTLISNLLKNDEKKENDFFKNNIRINLNLNKVYIDRVNFVNNLKGNLRIKNNKVYDGEILAFFDKTQNIQFTIKTTEEGEKITTLFSSKSKPLVDRYKFIKGFKDGKEGYLDFYSSKKGEVSTSKLVIDNFKVKEIPALAKLLALASLQGIADLLTGEGIRFTDFEMKFTNENKLMRIQELYAIGPAISILLEGYIEGDNLISLRGTLVPATTINRSIASIPLIGDLLIGKKVGEGVFGVSFKIKGPPKNLETTVNPIKTLTPRFITRTLEKIKKN